MVNETGLTKEFIVNDLADLALAKEQVNLWIGNQKDHSGYRIDDVELEEVISSEGEVSHLLLKVLYKEVSRIEPHKRASVVCAPLEVIKQYSDDLLRLHNRSFNSTEEFGALSTKYYTSTPIKLAGKFEPMMGEDIYVVFVVFNVRVHFEPLGHSYESALQYARKWVQSNIPCSQLPYDILLVKNWPYTLAISSNPFSLVRKNVDRGKMSYEAEFFEQKQLVRLYEESQRSLTVYQTYEMLQEMLYFSTETSSNVIGRFSDPSEEFYMTLRGKTKQGLFD